MFLQRFVTFVVGLVVIAGLIAIDTVVFRVAFESDYVHWYLENGAVIGIVFGLITLAWGDLNRMTGLISAHPHDYASTCFSLGVLPLSGASALIATRGTWLKQKHREREKMERLVEGVEAVAIDPERSEKERQTLEEAVETGRKGLDELTSEIEAVEDDDPPLAAPARGVGPIDVLLAIVFSFAFILLFAAWILVIAPLQYVVNLVAGAPARRATASPVRAWFRSTSRKLIVGVGPKREDLPEGATESRFSTSPVAFTAVVASALLLLVSRFSSL